MFEMKPLIVPKDISLESKHFVSHMKMLCWFAFYRDPFTMAGSCKEDHSPQMALLDGGNLACCKVQVIDSPFAIFVVN